MASPKTPCSCGCGGLGPKALPLAEASTDLEQSERTLRRYVAAGCPHHKGPGRTGPLTFERSEVVAWMQTLGRTGEMGRPPVEVTVLAGGPDSTRGKPMAESVAQVVAAKGQPKAKLDKPDDLSPDELRALGALVNVQIKQLEVRKRERQEREAEREVVPLAEAQRWLASLLQRVATELEAAPGRIASEAAGQSHDVVFSVSERVINGIRSQLADSFRG